MINCVWMSDVRVGWGGGCGVKAEFMQYKKHVFDTFSPSMIARKPRKSQNIVVVETSDPQI